MTAAFAAIAVLVGGNAVGIRFSNRELDPLWGAGLRFALAAIVLGAAMAVLRLELPRGRALTGALLFGSSTLAARSPSAITRSSSYTPGSVRSSLRWYRSRRCCSRCFKARSVCASWLWWEPSWRLSGSP